MMSVLRDCDDANLRPYSQDRKFQHGDVKTLKGGCSKAPQYVHEDDSEGTVPT